MDERILFEIVDNEEEEFSLSYQHIDVCWFQIDQWSSQFEKLIGS